MATYILFFICVCFIVSGYNVQIVRDLQIKTPERRRSILALIFGVFIGIISAFMIHYIINEATLFTIHKPKYPAPPSDPELNDCFKSGFPLLHEKKETPLKVVSGHQTNKPLGNAVAQDLYKRVRVLCWIMTHPKNHQYQALNVKKTWGKRCNKLIFFSTEEDESLPTVKLPVNEGREHLWDKTKAAFRYVYEHHRREADWFLKADDDTYVIVENLRYLLSTYNAKRPLYFGMKFKIYCSFQGFMSGGAGYVLSSGALEMFVDAVFTSGICNTTSVTLTGYYRTLEDLQMGKCLNRVGVKAVDTRDTQNRGRFFPFPLTFIMFPTNRTFWNNFDSFYNIGIKGLGCCSDYAISFHYVKPKMMHYYDYLIYNLHPYGISYIYDA